MPVLFIPGNAGSYKQVRPIAAEAAHFFHDVVQHDEDAVRGGVRSLDFFTVDFNEDITAFHGQTLLDQAEFLNEAIRYILSLYLDPRMSARDPDLPDPTSVIILGHSMGGIVARTMLVMPNYQANSINTIVTMSAPHARPPVTFDGQIVQIYNDINDYWRSAYSQQWANNNRLWHVTLVSIAGGGLDTVVPSDYASLESIVPDTHGFTVFTSTIPTVWTSMDHQAILWCDQFRKVVSRLLYDVVDVNRATQTKPRARAHESLSEMAPHRHGGRGREGDAVQGAQHAADARGQLQRHHIAGRPAGPARPGLLRAPAGPPAPHSAAGLAPEEALHAADGPEAGPPRRAGQARGPVLQRLPPPPGPGRHALPRQDGSVRRQHWVDAAGVQERRVGRGSRCRPRPRPRVSPFTWQARERSRPSRTCSTTSTTYRTTSSWQSSTRLAIPRRALSSPSLATTPSLTERGISASSVFSPSA